MKITANHPPSVNDLPDWITVGELARKVYADIVFDYALPQPWVDACIKRGFDPRGKFVWGYPDGCMVYGQPLPLTQEAAIDIPADMI